MKIYFLLFTMLVFCSGFFPTASNLTGPAKSHAADPSNWPQFRGAAGRGFLDGDGDLLPKRWSASENVAWKTDIPGRGWSSPIVWGDFVFLTSVINGGESEEPKKGLYFGGDRTKPSGTVHQWKIFCLDANTGDIRWQRQVHEGLPTTSIHLKSSYASETPVTDGQRVYCFFGNVGIFCFDFDGQEIWNYAIAPHKTRSGWGTAASPVLHRDRLYIVNDNDEDSFLLGIDTATGKEVLRVARDEKSNWATPYVWVHNDRTEIVTAGTGKVRSYGLDGTLLWWLEGMSSITIATPFSSTRNGLASPDELLYLSSGYVLDSLKPLYAIRPGAAGDISLMPGKSSNDFIAWSQPKAAPYNPTSLLYRDVLYVLYDQGIVSGYHPLTGIKLFGPQRLPNGRAMTSSPWAYGGNVFCLNEDGVTSVLEAADHFQVLHTNTLADDDMCMATPAISKDRLLIRTAVRLYCIQNQERP